MIQTNPHSKTEGQIGSNAMDDISSSPRSLMCAAPTNLVNSKNAICLLLLHQPVMLVRRALWLHFREHPCNSRSSPHWFASSLTCSSLQHWTVEASHVKSPIDPQIYSCVHKHYNFIIFNSLLGFRRSLTFYVYLRSSPQHHHYQHV